LKGAARPIQLRARKSAYLGRLSSAGVASLLSTYVSYQLIMRDLPKALDRVENQPVVDRETKYYNENIGKVTSIDEFVKDDRLFRYAMKAHGLEDMAYAKAFMVKAMKEGIKDEDSFANKLSDKRYADFVATYNFAENGKLATVYNEAQHKITANYAIQATIAGVDPEDEYVKADTAYYLANITKVKSPDQLLANERLTTYVLASYGLNATTETVSMLQQALAGGIEDPDSFANTAEDKRYLAIAKVFDFERLGEKTTTQVKAQEVTVSKFMRQTLEEDAGDQNEGVRLALYFERKAPELTNFYEALADPALARVVRTALSLPDSFASADIDKQVKLFADKIDIEDFSDPEKLGEFLTRFTSLWEIQNPSAPAQSSVAALYSQPSFGISADTLFAIQALRR
jgi:hypothetical protein